jgi:hypothetical protein
LRAVLPCNNHWILFILFLTVGAHVVNAHMHEMVMARLFF